MSLYFAEYCWLGGPKAATNVLIGVEDGVVALADEGIACPPGATKLPGLTIPGLVNAHSHAFHRALRARAHTTADFWTWRDGMYEIAARLDPDTYEALAAAAYAEMALAGVTSVGEFHYLHHQSGGAPYDDPNEMALALVRAAGTAGIRIVLIDALYLSGGFDRGLNSTQQRFCDGSAPAWADRVALLADELSGNPNATVAVAAHSVRAVPASGLRQVALVAEALDCPIHAHVSEQPAENEAAIAATGTTPVGMLADAGMLGPSFAAVHATHLTPVDIKLLGEAESSVVACPTTERDLGDGLGPFVELAASGCTLSVGSDSHATIDVLHDARDIELHDRARLGRRGVHTSRAIVTAATLGGARALGLAAGGLQPGAPADLTSICLESVRTAGSDNPLAAAAFAANSSDVTDVVVGGTHIVKGGVHASIPDVPGALSASITAVLEV